MSTIIRARPDLVWMEELTGQPRIVSTDAQGAPVLDEQLHVNGMTIIGDHTAVVGPSGRELSAQQALQHVGEHPASYQKAHRVEFVDALPMAPASEVDLKVLRERAV